MKQTVITLVGVAYIGKKPLKRDTTFGTRLVFSPGQVHQIEAFTANRMLQHDTVYALEDSAAHKAVLDKLANNKPVVQDTAPAKVTKTPQQIVDEEIEKLEASLKKLPRKDALLKHEVVTGLGLELDLSQEKKVLFDQVITAYRAHVEAKQGIAPAQDTADKADSKTTDTPADETVTDNDNGGTSDDSEKDAE